MSFKRTGYAVSDNNPDPNIEPALLPAGRDASGRERKDYKPRRRSKKEQTTFTRPIDTAEMVENMQRIIRVEIDRLTNIVRERELYLTETRMLEIYMRLLFKEQKKGTGDQFEDMTTEELMILARGMTGGERGSDAE